MNKINLLSNNWLALKINNDCLKQNLLQIKGRVVDLGCGTAPYREDILKIADEYIGVDWESSLHDQTHVDVFADLCKPLPFPDDYADTVVTFQVLEHLPEPELFLLECHRILGKGGVLFITVPFMWHVHEAPHDYFRYTRYGLEYLLKKVGFKEINIKENTGFWQMLALKFNYQTARYSGRLLKFFWVPIWWATQAISPVLDKFYNNPGETASYTVVARKINDIKPTQ